MLKTTISNDLTLFEAIPISKFAAKIRVRQEKGIEIDEKQEKLLVNLLLFIADFFDFF
jgi:hypothetical protein